MTDAVVVGRVARLARYPVKSLQGELVEQATFGPRGLVGDRLLGIVDAESDYVLTAKRVPELLEASARTTATGIEVRLPGSDWLPAPSAAASAAASEWLGRAVYVEPAPPDTSRNYSMTFNLDDETADVFDWHCPPGTFFDLADVHVLTTASLRAAAGRYPDGTWSAERFRPTILVEADGDDFVEDAWVGGRLRFGDAAEVAVDEPTIRCTMTTRAQGDLARDLDVLRTVNREHGGNLGLYCSMAASGDIAVGDEVRFLPA